MSVVNASVFTHQFLLAMPGMADPNFSGAVVYVAEHSAKGALGLVINRTMDIDLRTLFPYDWACIKESVELLRRKCAPYRWFGKWPALLR